MFYAFQVRVLSNGIPCFLERHSENIWFRQKKSKYLFASPIKKVQYLQIILFLRKKTFRYKSTFVIVVVNVTNNKSVFCLI